MAGMLHMRELTKSTSNKYHSQGFVAVFCGCPALNYALYLLPTARIILPSLQPWLITAWITLPSQTIVAFKRAFNINSELAAVTYLMPEHATYITTGCGSVKLTRNNAFIIKNKMSHQ